MTSFVAAMVVFGFGIQQDSKLVLDEPGIQLPELVAKIAAANGESLSVSPELSNEVFAVWQKEIGANELKTKLADIAYAKWSVRSTGQVLIPDVERINKIESDWNIRLSKSVTKSKEYIRLGLAKRLAIPKIVEEDYSWVHERFDDPSANLWAQIALQIPDSVYTGLSENERAVFSTIPNRMQKALNASSYGSIVSQWVKTYNEGIENNEEIDDSEYPPEYREYLALMKELEMDFTPKPVKEAPYKILAVVSGAYPSIDERYTSTPNLQITVYGKSGKTLVSYEDSLGSLLETMKGVEEYAKNKPLYDQQDEEGGPEDEYQDPYASEPRLPISNEAWMMIQAVKSQYNGKEQIVPNGVSEMFSLPTQFEPLRYLLGESYVAMAKHYDRGLIALLSDDDARNLSYEATADGVRAGFALDMLLRREIYSDYEGGPLYASIDQSQSAPATQTEVRSGQRKFEVPAGPFEVGPRDPRGYWESRVKRSDLEELVGIYKQDLLPSLDTLASFAARNPKAPYNSIREIVLLPFSGPGYSLWGTSNEWESLVFWGLLGKGNQATLRRGGQVPFSGLSKEAQKHISENLFGLYSVIGPLDKQRRKPAYLNQNFFGEESYYRVGMDLDSEPTELMPNGLPANGYLQGYVTNEPYVVQLGSSSKPNSYLSIPMNASEIAFSKAMYDMAGAESDIQPGHFNRLALGQRSAIELAIVVAPGTGQVMQLMDEKGPDISKTFSMLSLPGDFGRLVAEEEKKMNESAQMKLMKAMYKMNGSYREPIKP